MKVQAYAAHKAKGELKSFEYELAALKHDEVAIEVTYCGLCHSDLSMLDNDWRITSYPFVPGHEIVGKIIELGSHVRHLKVGQSVGVGWNVASCLTCDECMSGNHNLCNSVRPTIIGRYGGFGNRVKAQSSWVFPLPEGMDDSKAGPLFCGGITVFSPLLQHHISPLHSVGVIGIGGLGHLALAFLKAWGCEVTAFSTSPEKEEEARKLGAHHFVSTHDKDALKKLSGRFDMVLDTVSADLDWNGYLKTLKANGVFHIVGVAGSVNARAGNLMGKKRVISASPTGSPSEIRQMLQFAARHKVEPMVEAFRMSEVNEAMEKLRNGKPRYRIVLEVD